MRLSRSDGHPYIQTWRLAITSQNPLCVISMDPSDKSLYTLLRMHNEFTIRIMGTGTLGLGIREFIRGLNP
jgi:hypothetical protein